MASLGPGFGQPLALCCKDSDPSYQSELTLHMSIHPAVSCSQSNRNVLIYAVKAVAAVGSVEVRMLLMSFFL